MSTIFVATLAAKAGLHAAKAAPGACAVLSDADAARLVEGALGQTDKLGRPASAQNGNDCKSACVHFSRATTSRRRPDRPSAASSSSAHDAERNCRAALLRRGARHAYEQREGTAGARRWAVVAMTGVGEDAYLKRTMLADPTARITTLTFLKGSTVASVQAWKTAAPVDESARAAALQVAARLP